MSRACAADLIANIRQNKVKLIYWNEADKERIVLQAYDLARARSALQHALARDPGADGQEFIHRCICDIDEHFRTHHWPSAIAEDDPVLLKELWHRQQNRIVAARQLPDDGTRAARIAGLASEGNRVLRTLLGLPATVSAQAEAEPVTTRDLVAALQTGTDRLVAKVVEEELEARYPTAYGFLAAALWMPDYRQTQPHHRIEADEQPGILPIPDPESPGIDGADREPRHRPRRTGATAFQHASPDPGMRWPRCDWWRSPTCMPAASISAAIIWHIPPNIPAPRCRRGWRTPVRGN